MEDNAMSIFGQLFTGSTRRLLKQMCSDTNVIMVAVYSKLFSIYEPKYGHERAATVAAAVANKLFARVSPMHSKEDLQLAEDLATGILKTDHEIRYAAVISCRARLLFEADKNAKSEETRNVWDNIQWMASIWNLPPDKADPTLIRQLAITLYKKYSQK
jgi:hypothetical protein